MSTTRSRSPETHEEAPEETPEETPEQKAKKEAEKVAAEALAIAEKDGRQPHLLEGQRVVVTEGDYKGRMAYVLAVDFEDVTQLLLSKAGVSESRFAKAANYICRTRDGREDVFVATPDEIEPLEPNNGWGRGTI